MKYILIAAMANDRSIGIAWQLPWKNPEDLANFKRLTTWGIVVMGRVTYESIGRPLPNRRNIILSSRRIEGMETYDSVESMGRQLENERIDSVFIIGWRKVYDSFLLSGSANEIWLSEIAWVYLGDTFFPLFESDFKEMERKKFETFEFVKYLRK